jgi:hypothetical protein
MSNLREIRRSFQRVAGKAITKTGDITDTASIHVKLVAKQAGLADLYEQYGRVAYQKAKTGANVDHKMKILMEKIDVVRAEIYSLKKAIDDKKVLKQIELQNATKVEAEIHKIELNANKND